MPPRKPRQLKSQELQNQILKLLYKNPRQKFDAVQIARKLNVANPTASIYKECVGLVSKGLAVKDSKEAFKLLNPKKSKPSSVDIYQGYVDMTRSGAAYITNTEAEEDIYIPSKALGGALHKDLVKVEVSRRTKSRRPEGKIIEIVERSIRHVIGSLQVLQKFGVVRVNQPKNFPEVFIPLDDIREDMDEAVVRVEITHWGQAQNKSIWGHILSVLDKENENEIAMQNILLSNGFTIDFPEKVLQEASSLHQKINETENTKRRDFRQKICFTIDPLTAKDFDDAVSLEKLENGRFEIGIHIADVTHFLEENSLLDKEALDRSTSVYIADRVCPMLPEELSNHLCSLIPNEDRYTFSAVFDMDVHGTVHTEWYGKTIIHSKRRFTYEEAQERIETGEGDFAEEVRLLNEIAKKLRKHRFDSGSINFESEEVQFVFGDHMVPLSISVKERKDAHMLIEDLMLLANRKVAEYMFKKTIPPIPFVYRVHDLPNPDKLSDFARYAKELGFNFYMKTPTSITESFNRLADEMRQNDTLKLLEPMAIRTMSKAEYTPHNIGHYGLGFDYYTHFTSPIRRYADVMVHRILFENLQGEKRRDITDLEKKTKHISLQERKAMDAERESIKYKLAEYMSFHIGKIFHGIISGIIEKGIFVEIIETKAEGFLSFDDLPGHYVVTEDRFKAYSKRGEEDFFIGKKVTVKVIDADKSSQKVFLELVSSVVS